MKQFEELAQQLVREGYFCLGNIRVKREWSIYGTVYSVTDVYDDDCRWECATANQAIGIVFAGAYVADRDDFELSYGATHIAFADDKELLMQIAKQKQEQQFNVSGWAHGAVITDNFTGEIVWELDERLPEIASLELSVRSYNCLRRAGYTTIEQLKNMSLVDMQNVRNLGRKSRKEILEKLIELDECVNNF